MVPFTPLSLSLSLSPSTAYCRNRLQELLEEIKLTPNLTDNEFVVLKEFGRGAFSVVNLVKSRRSNDEFARKV